MKCEDVSSFLTPLTGVELPQSIRIGQRLKGLVGRVGMAIATWVTQSSELKVSERCDRHGNVYYQVYDPLNRTSASFGSEAEIRAWLEQRYYR
jgi:hypothetical protein